MKKRIFAFLLAFVMLVGMLPMTAMAADGYTITTGDTTKPSSWQKANVISQCVITGAAITSSTVSDDSLTWDVYLPSNTDTSAELSYTISVKNNRIGTMVMKAQASFNGAAYVKTKKDTSSVYTATFSGVPEWSNGEATVTFAVASDGMAANARTYTLKLHIDDGKNDAPVLSGEKSAAKTLRVDDTYELDLSGIFKDSDSKELSYKVSINEGEPVIAAVNYNYIPKETGTHTLVFTASDGDLTSEAYTVTLTVIENIAPALAGEATATETGIQNQAWTLDLGKVFTDEEGDALTYTVAIDGAEPVAADASYSYTPTEAREYTLVFQATDIKGDVSPAYTVTLKVTKNTAPVLVDGSELSADAMHGLPWTLDLTKVFADNEGDPLTYTVSVNGAAAVSANAGYSYTPTAAGTDTLVFQAADGKDSTSPVYTVTLNVTENPAPVLTGDASASASVDQYKVWNIDLVPLFKDNDGDSLTYSVSVDGAAAVSANANYSYTANTSGEKTLAFFATDKAGNVSSAYTVTLTVNYVPRTIIATGCVDQAGKSFDAWVDSITVTGPVITEYQWIGGTGHDETSDSDHVLNILLDPATPDDATITLAYSLGGNTNQGTVSGTTSVTLENGTGIAKVTSKAKNIASWAQTRNYTINFANKQNGAPVATAPTAVAEVTVGSDFTIDLSKVFSDPNGDALTYSVTANGETVATQSVFTQTMGNSGEYTFTFTATDVWNATATHTVTVTVKQSSTTFNAIVKVPEGITPNFYITSGFDDEKVDICGDALTATAGTAENGFVPYTVQVPENVSRISFRGTDAEGNAWGGMTAEVSKDMEPVTIVKVLGVIPGKVNNVYATAQQALFQLKDKDGYYATSGSTVTDDYGIVNYRFLAVAFGTDDLALAYTAYVVPQGGAEGQYVTTIGSNKTFTKEEPQQITQLGMTLKSSFTVTVPEGATVQAFQWKQYYKADGIPVSDIVKNEDGTESWIFVKGDAYRMTYRASMEGKITKAGYVNGDAVTITWSDSDPAPSCRKPYDTSTLYGSRGDDSMVVNVNGQNHLVMANGGTFRLRGYRIWEIINNDTNNVMIQPDMHYTLTGDKIVTVTPVNTGNGNGKNNWLDLKATGSGVAYLEMSYDAMQIVTGNASGWGGEELGGFVFNACDPARTALVVVQVGNAATDVSFGIKNTSTVNGSAVPWDAEFDTLYFTGSSGKLELAPTVSSGSIAKVEVSGNKGASWTELTAVDGVYMADIVSGNNIIRVTKADGTEGYQVVRGDKISVTMTETKGNGNNVPEAGESFRVWLSGVHNPIGKMAGNYNPGYGGGQHLYYNFNGATVYTTVNYQYDFVSNAWVDVTIPETAKPGDTFTLDNGYIGFNVIGISNFLNNKENHRGITDAGHMTRGTTGTDHRRSILPEITLTVRDSAAEITNVINLINAIAEAEDKAAAIAAARSAYNALSAEQKKDITNYDDLTAAEKALADATDAAAAEAVEHLIRQIGQVTLEKEAAIASVRSSYEDLTQTQKELVDPELLDVLSAAESELVVLKDKKAAADVDKKIDAIGEVTLSSKAAIEEAKEAYSALTNAQRRYVTKLATLEAAEKKLKVLQTTGGIDYGISADEIIGYVTVSFEDYGVRVEGESINGAYATPRGVIIPATKVPFKPYDTIASVTLRLLKSRGVSASYQGSEFSGFYLSAIDGYGEFDAGSGSGWMVTWNGWFINKGASEFAVKDGDTVRWQYTCQLGADIGDNSYYGSVTNVVKLIDDIGTVTKDSGKKIQAARAAYDKLSANDKKRVSNHKKLTDAEAAYEALLNEAVEKVEKQIDAIGTVTLKSKEKIEAARKAYDALPTAQKLKVDNYSKLTDAESKYAELEAAEDQKRANAVEDSINAIKEGSAAFEDDVKAAQDAYNKLTAGQKKLVDNYYKLASYLKQLADEEDIKASEAVERLIEAIGTVTKDSEDKIEAARAAYDKLTDEQKVLIKNLAVLEAAEEKLAQLKDAALGENIYKTTGDYLEKLGTPVPGSVGGEWMVIGLNRSGRKVPDAYYDNAVTFVQENIDENERLHSAKSTENSRMILALTALGKDVTNVGGHNLLVGLNSMEYVQKQGINGPIWALIAFDSGNYPTPDGDVTRKTLIDTILSAQLPDGGWTLSGSISDPDMTGMALQALAPYYNTGADVKKAVDAALINLSDAQRNDGSFSSIDGKNIESIAQVVTALAALGIDADTDPRFIKNGVSALDALCAFYVEGGGFRHTPDGKLDGMATEQGYYALTAYFRMLDQKTALYDMTDVLNLGGDVVIEEPVETLPAETEPAPTESAETPAKSGRSFPWWLVIVIAVLAGAIVVLVIVAKPKKGRHVKK